MKTKNDYCKEFVEKRGISPERISDLDVEAVYWLEYSRDVTDLSFGLHVERLMNNPAWGLIQTMLDRVYEYAAAGLILLSVGQPSSGEVVARTTVEAAINVLYVLRGNRLERLWQYFTSYIAEERRQNKLWLDSISDFDDDDKQVHQSAIERKEKVLEDYELVVNAAFQQTGLPTRAEARWPKNVFEKFRALGMETAYRTVYAAMCSQAHNDAEDLLNKFAIHVTDAPELNGQLALEAEYFARMLVYFGLQFYLEATRSYAQSFGLTEAKEELDKGYEVIAKLIAEIIESLQSLSISGQAVPF